MHMLASALHAACTLPAAPAVVAPRTHYVPNCPARLAAGGELALVGIEGAQGRPLDRDVRDLIAAFGSGFIVLLAIWMVTNDLEALGAFMFNQAAQLAGAPQDVPPLAAALLPLLPPQ